MSWSFKAFEPLNEKDFQQWSKLLEERTGISLTAQQKLLLQTQVSIRMRELDIEQYPDYFAYVNSGTEGIAEWQILVDRLVVKETMFFRHEASLRVVECLLEKSLDQNKASETFDIWSLGCSTGEEPYSLAMVANDCFESFGRKPYFGITASDVSLPALTMARHGIYPERRLTLVSDELKAKYFEKNDANSYRISDTLKQRICFIQANILWLSRLSIHLMDVIFCQNVLIYFRKWRRKEILNHLVSRLKPGGLLVIGLGEITDWQHPDLEQSSDEQVQAYIKKVDQ